METRVPDEEENNGSRATDRINADDGDRMINTTKRKVMAMVDLKKNLDRLDRHLDRVILLESNKKHVGGATAAAAQEWEIDSGKLVVGKLIGRGAYAAVHRGTYDGQDVAVKILECWKEEGEEEDCNLAGERRKAQLSSRLRHEASLWHQLHHPNVCEESACCIVTRYQGGGTLRSYLEKRRRLRKKLSLKKVLNLALQLAKGIAYLHSRKVIHRDVKPDNVVLDDGKSALKIIDFGVARMEPPNPAEMAGQIGTIGYMAPEVFECRPYDRKCDVYSFGISLWEIYCCDSSFAHYGFSQNTSASVYKNVRPEIPRNCPELLAELMKQCWEIEPARRPAMREVVSMLEAIEPSKKNSKSILFPPQCFCIRSPPSSNI
ncbi:Serine/threonine-protein kinase STY13 [Linum perenne]